jgi:PAS domain S-box-containing protein
MCITRQRPTCFTIGDGATPGGKPAARRALCEEATLTVRGRENDPAASSTSIDEQVDWARSVLWDLRVGDGQEAEAAGVLLDVVNRLEAMLEHTTDMITVIAANGTIRFSNAAAGALTGHDEAVNGSSAFSLIHPDDMDVAADAFARCVNEPGSEIKAEFRLRYADDSWHHVEAYAKNCLDDPAAGVVVSMRDITERKENEAALVAANQAMQEFVAVASHELRTPTSVIRGFASTLEQRWAQLDEDSKVQFLGAIARSSERLGRLVDDLLIVSRLDAGVADGDGSSTELADTVAAALEELGDDAVDVESAVEPGILVRAERHVVRRIVRNFVENALRYGGLPIRVEATVGDGTVDIIVRDQGPGIPDGFEDKLFERFARADRNASRESGGTGLGLSIVLGMAQAAGGNAWYERNEPHGSCFVARLPLA